MVKGIKQLGLILGACAVLLTGCGEDKSNWNKVEGVTFVSWDKKSCFRFCIGSKVMFQKDEKQFQLKHYADELELLTEGQTVTIYYDGNFDIRKIELDIEQEELK